MMRIPWIEHASFKDNRNHTKNIRSEKKRQLKKQENLTLREHTKDKRNGGGANNHVIYCKEKTFSKQG